MSRLRPLALIALSSLACACVSTREGSPRETELPASALGLSGPSYSAPGQDWWLALGDPQLDRLVGQALADNPSLGASLARVRGAWEQTVIAGAGDSPKVDFDVSAYRQKVSGNYLYPPPYAGSTFWDGRIGFNLAWNLDFWGRQAALIEQVRSSALAAELDAAGAALAISGAMSQTYVDLKRVTDLGQLADRAARQREELLGLTRQRVQAGLDSDVELRTAEAGVAQSAGGNRTGANWPRAAGSLTGGAFGPGHQRV